MNLQAILNVVGVLLILLAGILILPIGVSLYFQDPPVAGTMDEIYAFGWAAFLSSATGFFLWQYFPSGIEKLRDREGFAIVGFAWIAIVFFGSLPLYLTGACPLMVDAVFETMSGFTTTGASVLNHIDLLPHGILFWRNLMQWMGGMGIILLSLAIFPALGIGSFHLFKAEIPGGGTVERMMPRLAETAKVLWKTYVVLTLAETALLMAGGMDWFDAVCHSFSTVATGGFSTHSASVGYFNNLYFECIILVFMFLGGINFALHYHLLHRNFRVVFENPELKVYLGILVVGVSLAAFGLHHASPEYGLPQAFRVAAFNVVSVNTTTGFSTHDFNTWPGYLRLFLVCIMMVGGCSGSTSGSLKTIRFLILFKVIMREFQKLIHPRAIITIKVGGKPMAPDHVMNVVALTSLFMGITLFSSFILVFLGVDGTTAISASIATLFNIGPGLGEVGPATHYADLPGLGKWMTILWMLMGRLEIFGIMLLFLPTTWRR
ncbi:MAG: TrkH family potassium uptake protein [Nitrospinaceae bacterium]